MKKIGDLNPAFSSGGRSSNNPDSSFNSRPPSSLSKPRLSKVRKQVKPSGTSCSVPGLGFNKFHHRGSFPMYPGPIASDPLPGETGFSRSSNDSFVFGSIDRGTSGKLSSSDDVGKRVMEAMRKLNIVDENGYKMNSSSGGHFKLPEDMQNLNINDSNSSFHFDENARKKVEDELRTLFSNKLTIDVNKDSFDSSFSSTEHVIQECMEKLNISAKDKASFVSKGKPESLDYVGEKILSDDLFRKLNVGSIASDGKLSPGSVQGSVNEKKFHDSSSSCPVNYSFVGTEPREHLNPRNVNDMTSTVNTSEFNFFTNQDSGETNFMEFKTPNSKPNPFYSLDQKLGFNAKKDNVGATRAGRKGDKQPVTMQLNVGHEFAYEESAFPHGSNEAPNSSSPMDASPYEQTEDCRDFSATSDQVMNPDKSHFFSDFPPPPNDVLDAELIAATERMEINEGDDVNDFSATSDHVMNPDKSHFFSDLPPPPNDVLDAEIIAATELMEINEGDDVNDYQDKEFNTGKCADHEDIAEDSISGAETESYKSAMEDMETSSETFVTASENEVTSSYRPYRQENDDHFLYNSDAASSSFTFSASSFSGVHGQPSTSNRINRKKNPSKLGQDPYIFIPHVFSSKTSQRSPVSSVQSPFSTGKPSERDPLRRIPNPINNSVMDKARDENDASNAAQEACEKWRLRGNNAYKNGDLSRAEEFYTQGIDSVPKIDTPRNCLRELMLSYSNRAATRMALGRMREAISDCTIASSIDSNFLKVQVRAAK